MPIVVPCLGCPTKLSAPESAAGKQIRCPKCKAVVPVLPLITAEEVPVVEAKLTAPAPKPNPPPATVDEDEGETPRKKTSRRAEEDEEDDAPRKKKKKRQVSRTRRNTHGGGIVLAVVGVVLIGAVVTGAVLLFRKETSSQSATGTNAPSAVDAGTLLGPGAALSRTPPPAGWKQYNYPASGLRAYFSDQPMTLRTTYGSESPPGIEVPQHENAYTYTTRSTNKSHANVVTIIEVQRFKGSISDPMRKLVLGPTYRDRGAGRGLRWLGGEAVEAVKGNSVSRTAVLDRMILDALIINYNGPPTAQEAAGFFDNIEVTR